MSKLRVGIIGHGKVGRIRRSVVEEHSDLELSLICDIDPVNVVPGVPFFTDWRDALEEPLDLVFVCTTNDVIPEIATRALGKRIHTFCEKPSGRTVEDVARIRDAEQRNAPTRLKFGFNHRYHEAVKDAKALVDKGRLGRILWMRGVYGKAGGPNYDTNWRNDPARSGGGILMDQGLHMLDLFHLFCGEFDEVKSFIARSYWQVPVEDNAFAMMRNKARQVAMIHSSATQWRHSFQLDIYLERGYLNLVGILSTTRTYEPEELRIARCVYDKDGYPLPNPKETVNYYSEDRSWEREVNEFVDCIKFDKPIEHGTSADALATMRLVHRIYEADESWKPPLAGPL